MLNHATPEQLIAELISKGIHDQTVLNAIRDIPRHDFVDEEYLQHAYQDMPIPIECYQTISQPYVVAKMVEAIMKEGSLKKVLEIGTGSGYHAAVLSKIFEEVYTIERIKVLYHRAEKVFKKLSLTNIHQRFDDGSQGWLDNSPYDAIVVTAAAPSIPPELLAQLIEGGRLIMPIGGGIQQALHLVTKHQNTFETMILDPVIFVPLLPGIEI